MLNSKQAIIINLFLFFFPIYVNSTWEQNFAILIEIDALYVFCIKVVTICCTIQQPYTYVNAQYSWQWHRKWKQKIQIQRNGEGKKCPMSFHTEQEQKKRKKCLLFTVFELKWYLTMMTEFYVKFYNALHS